MPTAGHDLAEFEDLDDLEEEEVLDEEGAEEDEEADEGEGEGEEEEDDAGGDDDEPEVVDLVSDSDDAPANVEAEPIAPTPVEVPQPSVPMVVQPEPSAPVQSLAALAPALERVCERIAPAAAAAPVDVSRALGIVRSAAEQLKRGREAPAATSASTTTARAKRVDADEQASTAAAVSAALEEVARAVAQRTSGAPAPSSVMKADSSSLADLKTVLDGYAKSVAAVVESAAKLQQARPAPAARDENRYVRFLEEQNSALAAEVAQERARANHAEKMAAAARRRAVADDAQSKAPNRATGAAAHPPLPASREEELKAEIAELKEQLGSSERSAEAMRRQLANKIDPRSEQHQLFAKSHVALAAAKHLLGASLLVDGDRVRVVSPSGASLGTLIVDQHGAGVRCDDGLELGALRSHVLGGDAKRGREDDALEQPRTLQPPAEVPVAENAAAATEGGVSEAAEVADAAKVDAPAPREASPQREDVQSLEPSGDVEPAPVAAPDAADDGGNSTASGSAETAEAEADAPEEMARMFGSTIADDGATEV